ncbi:hypothetical protein ACFQ14_08600 [Pseudahrensia aquimaris]|uniref:Uncharacterized protein n=1 Tax=Pseudahrensia aquimaris TaxID=744461 RepID=A0ABW3FDC6_9HYPH
MSKSPADKATFVARDISSLSPLNQGGSDGGYVKDQYEHHWGKKIDGLKTKIARGETLEHMIAVLRSPPHLNRGYNRVGGHPAKQMLEDFTGTHDDIPLSRLACSEGRYTVINNFDPVMAITRLANSFTNIVELGAGPGWNLFNICTYLGNKAQARKFFGLEYSDAGIEVMKLLGDHGKLPMHATFFDYTAPDISMVPDDKPTMFFSHLSIEQVEDISGDLYEQLAARKSRTKLIHCEPIGWQRFPEMVEARVNGDDKFFHDLIEKRLDDVRGPDAVAINGALNSWRVRYNRNTLPLLHKFEAEGKLTIQRCYYDFTHSTNVNPANPSTYVEIDFHGADA